MNTQDILSLFAILAIFIITACVVLITFYLISALKSVNQLAEDLDETVQGVKNKLSLKALSAIPALIVAVASKVIKKKRG